jgi:hypothetical protein
METSYTAATQTTHHFATGILTGEISHTPLRVFRAPLIDEPLVQTPLGTIKRENNNESFHLLNIHRFLNERARFSISDPWTRYIGDDGAFYVKGFDKQPEKEIYDLSKKSPEFWDAYEYKERAKAEVQQVINAEKLVQERPDGPLAWIAISPPEGNISIDTVEGRTFYNMIFVVSRSVSNPKEYEAFQIYHAGADGERAEDLQHKANILAAVLDPSAPLQPDAELRGSQELSNVELIQRNFVIQDIPDETIKSQMLNADGQIDKNGVVRVVSSLLGREIRGHEQERQDFNKIMEIMKAEGVFDRYIHSMIRDDRSETMREYHNHMVNRFDYLMTLYKQGSTVDELVVIAEKSAHIFDSSDPVSTDLDEKRNSTALPYDVDNSPFERARKEAEELTTKGKHNTEKSQSEGQHTRIHITSADDIERSEMVASSPRFMIPSTLLSWTLTSVFINLSADSRVKSKPSITVKASDRPVPVEAFRQPSASHNVPSRPRTSYSTVDSSRRKPSSKTEAHTVSPTNNTPDRGHAFFIISAPVEPKAPPKRVLRLKLPQTARTASRSRGAHHVQKTGTTSSHNVITEISVTKAHSTSTTHSTHSEQVQKLASSSTTRGVTQGSARTRTHSSIRQQMSPTTKSSVTKPGTRTISVVSSKQLKHTSIASPSTTSTFDAVGTNITNTATTLSVLAGIQSPSKLLHRGARKRALARQSVANELDKCFTPHQIQLLLRFCPDIQFSGAETSLKLTPGQVQELRTVGFNITAAQDGLYTIHTGKERSVLTI